MMLLPILMVGSCLNPVPASHFQEPGITLPGGQIVAPGVVNGLRRQSLAEQEERLTKLFEKVDASIAFTPPPTGIPISTLQKIQHGVGEFDWLARSCSCRLHELNGAYIASPAPLDGSGRTLGKDGRQFFEWLDGVEKEGGDQLSSLINGGISLSSMDQQGQAIIGTIWSEMPHAIEGMAKGIPVNVSVTFIPDLMKNGKSVNPDATSFVGVTNGCKNGFNKFPNERLIERPFIPSQEGEMDFESGKAMTIGELAEKAANTYSLTCEVDKRISQNPIFLKGKFTKSRLASVLRTIGSSGPLVTVRETTSEERLAFLKRQILAHCLNLNGNTDPKNAYLISLLDNPTNIDQGILRQFGYSSDDCSRATSVSVGMVIMISSDTVQRNINGTMMTLPEKSAQYVRGN